MKPVRPTLAILLALFFFNTVLIAQETGPTATWQIRGEVRSSDEHLPLEFATVTVLDEHTGQMIAGTVTGPEGRFSIELRPAGYILRIEHITYEPKTVDSLPTPSNSTVVNLGKIMLIPQAETLAEVRVTAEKSQLQMMLDKKIYNVDKDIASTGTSANDMLDNIPFISVDQEGRVSLRGSTNVRILIDGKPSGLSNPEALQLLQTNVIDRVEVITNPAARYDAEGLAGIINIVLKKEADPGVNGSVDMSTGLPHNHKFAANLNYRRNKINFFTNAGLSYWERPGKGTYDNEYNLASGSYFTQLLHKRTRRSLSPFVNIGTDYHFDDKNVLTTSVLYDYARQPHSATNFYRDFDAGRHPITNELRTDEELELAHSLEYSLNYERKFEQKDRALSLALKWMDNSEAERSDFEERQTDVHLSPIDNAILEQRSRNKESDRNFLLQLDYSTPLGKDGKFESGLKTTLRRIHNDYLVEENSGSQWSPINAFSDQFDYREDIYSAYALWAGETG